VLLTKTFPADVYASGLESWSWLDLNGKVPVLASLFGDVFLQSSAGYWYLDTIEGKLTQVWRTRDEVQATLERPDGQDQYLLGGLAVAAEQRGLILSPSEVYTFVPPPVLGGGFDADHIQTIDFVVGLNLAGQLHEQIRDLPPGTKISGFTYDGDQP
jgi:hypothetical protein